MKRKSLILIIASIILISQNIVGQINNGMPVNNQDSLELIELYNSTDGPNWTKSYQWLSSSYPIYLWYGVDPDEDRVIKVELYNNNLSGSVPSTIGNLSALTSLKLNKNNLTGEIPSSIGNITELKYLYLSQNELTGKIPHEIGNLTKLIRLYLHENNLSDTIPSEFGKMTDLKHLHLDKNKLTGTIPPELGNLNKLEYFHLSDNELTGKIPPDFGNLTNVSQLHLENNKLNGTIPPELFNCTQLTELDLAENELSGPVPSSISKIKPLYLDLSSNQLTSLPEMYYQPFLSVKLQNNKFNFSDLEQFAPKLGFVKYAPQANLEIKKTATGETIELSMDAEGTQTTYQWFYNSVEVSGATNKTYTVTAGKDVQKYHCEAKNDLLPELTLIGRPTDNEKDCWKIGQLDFCLSSGTWEKASGNNKIMSTDIISINDFLYFNGSMTIDTTILEIQANGEFYVKDIPLPGGGVGKYTLSLGQHNLKLLGNDGKLTNFLNSTLAKTAILFGTPLKINDLQLVKRQDTLGIKIGCSVNIPRLSAGCGHFSTGTDIALKNLEITNEGISLGGFDIENLGLFKNGYCLKKLTYNYDSKKDVLIGGMDITLPFFANIGGGFRFEKGDLDSVAWSFETGDDAKLQVLPIVGSFGVKGFYGHIAGLNNPVKLYEPDIIDIKLGGVFSDITTNNLYRITGDGRTIWPTIFEVAGTGKFLKPTDELPFQVAGGVKMSYDVPNKQLKVDFDGNFGTLDEQTWLIRGDGYFTVDHRSEPTKFSGSFGGDFTLPKLTNDWPFSWINTFFSFPVTMGTRNVIFNENLNMVHGLLYFYPLGGNTPYKIDYILNVEKSWYEEGYIKFPETSRIYIEIETKSGLLASNVTETYVIPENTAFAVLEINSQGNAPESILINPTGKEYTTSSSNDNVIYSESEDGKAAFWSVFEPNAGDWSVTLENPGENDTIISYFQLKEKEFEFSINQTSSTVTINWDIAQVYAGQTVNIMLDDDDAYFDGFLVKKGDATTGSLSFSLDESTPSCNYYLFVQLIDEYSVIQSYADEMVNNPLASLAPPENFTSQYNSETGEFEFDWNASTSPDITGYILTITDSEANDSVYAILNNNHTNISVFIEDFATKSAKIESFNDEWKIGCPSTLNKLTTSIENNFQIERGINMIKVYPNPTTGNCTIRYYVSEPSKCEIRIFNIQGKEIVQPLTGFQPAGFHQFDFMYEHLPNGIYLIKYITNNQSVTVKSILSR